MMVILNEECYDALVILTVFRKILSSSCLQNFGDVGKYSIVNYPASWLK
jgi:hypothetical protein